MPRSRPVLDARREEYFNEKCLVNRLGTSVGTVRSRSCGLQVAYGARMGPNVTEREPDPDRSARSLRSQGSSRRPIPDGTPTKFPEVQLAVHLEKRRAVRRDP